MPRSSSVYTCSHCDAQYPKWVGRCASCGQFGTVGTTPVLVGTRSATVSGAAPATVMSLSGMDAARAKYTTGSKEVDRVLGGGFTSGSTLLLTGNPGIGKSTLVLALAAHTNGRVLYASGEESADQVGARLKRLKLSGEHISFSPDTDIRAIASVAGSIRPVLLVVDSLQTFAVPAADGAAGSPTQVRAVLAELVALTKATTATVIIIGHVTKAGVAAGPKSVEHLVDVVLALEGEPSSPLRILRAAKNRFGPTDEVGVLQSSDGGLTDVANPSALFLAERHQGAGSCVTALVQGSRSLLVEVQALVTHSRAYRPARATTGFDTSRLQVLLAVLAERAGVRLGTSDVYINLPGGLKSREPALDLAVCLAAASAALRKPVPRDAVVFGEVGLGGEVRPVVGAERRLQEASRLGFRQAVVAPLPKGAKLPPEVALAEVRSVTEAVDWLR